MADMLTAFEDGRGVVLRQVLEQINITGNLDDVRRYCEAYLETVQARGRAEVTL